MTVERIGHNLGKIHDAEWARFRVSHFEIDGKTPHGEPEILEIPGSKFRKAGLGKDVTDKFLSGLPGIQKEGCDGIITSARFILHRAHAHTRTVCLEFFGQVHEAVPAIVEKVDYFGKPEASKALLAGLEHLDERTSRQWATQPSPGAARCPRWCCLPTWWEMMKATAQLSAEAAPAARSNRVSGQELHWHPYQPHFNQ